MSGSKLEKWIAATVKARSEQFQQQVEAMTVRCAPPSDDVESLSSPPSTSESTVDWREAAGHIECGAHSGIRPCCIAFFIFEWLPLAERDVAAAWRQYPKVEGASYVVCPDCREQNRPPIEIQTCPPGNHINKRR
jgi:hypothetical protein